MTSMQFLLINLGALITAAGGVFLKRLSTGLGTSMEFSWTFAGRLAGDLNLWLGGLCYVLPIVFWTYLLRDMDLTKLQPLLALVYIYSVGVAWLFLGERPSAQRLAGIGVIIVGVVLVGKS